MQISSLKCQTDPFQKKNQYLEITLIWETLIYFVTLVQNLKSSWHTEVICSKQIFLAMDELFPELLWIALFVGGDSSV